LRKRLGFIFVISFPFNKILPAVGFINCKMALPSVVLPQPLSPTSPSVSPFSTLKVTSSTALKKSVALPNIFFLTGK